MNHLIHRNLLVLSFLVTMFAGKVPAAEFFVSPGGSDLNPGTKGQPFATLKKASGVLQPGDTCYLRKGVYREVLRPARSGRPDAEITYLNFEDEEVVINGADVISGWIDQGNDTYAAPMSWNLGEGNQVFADGKLMSEACWPASGESPLFHPNRAIAEGGTTTTLSCDQIPGPDDAWKGARLWCAGGAAWICWSADVTGYDEKRHTLVFKQPQEKWYTPKQGSLFVLSGLRRALQTPEQWFYDSQQQQLLFIPPNGADIHQLVVEAKRRTDAIDLSGRSHIRICGIGFKAAGVRTDKQSSHIVLEGLRGRYVSHSNRRDVSKGSGVLVFGNQILLLSCDFGYSSSSVVSVQGHDNRVINCLIHHGGYGGLWRGTVSLSGRRIVFSHNTVRHAGRDLINTHGLMESLVQYNDVSDAGWLTKDLGMFYGHNTDFANTEFRFNLVHDNRAEHCSMGIYFDHLSHNAIVHHNVVWNVGMDPIRFNNPSYCNLVFNNTCARSGKVGTFDHSHRNDLFASHYFHNVFNQPVNLPEHVMVRDNRMIESPVFRDPSSQDYRLTDSVGDGIGAYAPSGRLWRAGCDLDHSPTPLPSYRAPRVAWMNTIRNACFEFGTLEGWQKTGTAQASLVAGNGWGNSVLGSGKSHGTGTSKYELRLGPGRDGISQVVKGLSPGLSYTLSAWLRVADEKNAVVLSVKQEGEPEVSASCSSTEWKRESIEFKTGRKTTEVAISVRKATDSKGHAWCDNLTLPLASPLVPKK